LTGPEFVHAIEAEYLTPAQSVPGRQRHGSPVPLGHGSRECRQSQRLGHGERRMFRNRCPPGSWAEKLG
jgi:hypothetical protein